MLFFSLGMRKRSQYSGIFAESASSSGVASRCHRLSSIAGRRWGDCISSIVLPTEVEEDVEVVDVEVVWLLARLPYNSMRDDAGTVEFLCIEDTGEN